ncbi:unnamed protein product [Penicillium olsonii]|nr:unnamed protein product [Penicillium olsonii]
MLDRRGNVESCHPNTCKWILNLERYRSWTSEPRGLLWIKGKPGAGKSTLMAFLHSELSKSPNQGIRLDFFFTARGVELQRTPVGMLRSLLNQILGLDPTVGPQIRKAYGEQCRRSGTGEGLWGWPKNILEDLFADVILASASRQHVTVFIDALDETGAESAQKLVKYFHRLLEQAEKAKTSLRICIACRHYPNTGNSESVEIHVEKHNNEDIASYIKESLNGTDMDPSPSQDKPQHQMLMESLIQQLNGVFQWAHLMIPLTQQRILDGVSFDDICCWISNVPTGLEDMYLCILKNVIQVWNLQESFLLFQWLSLAERPLTVTEMRYALAAGNAQITRTPKAMEDTSGFIQSDTVMKQRIKALSGGLAEVISSGGLKEVVQVIHQSVNDFLRKEGLAVLSDLIGASSPGAKAEDIVFQSQASLYRSCLYYLAIHHLRGQTSRKCPESQDDLIQNHPFLFYATTNLFIHAGKAAQFRAFKLHNEQGVLAQVISHWTWIYKTLQGWSDLCPRIGTTVLHMAAAANLVDILERVPPKRETLSVKDEDGNTALHLAARHGHITGVRILRGKGADCESGNIFEKTPLIEAASFGNVKFVKWIVHSGAGLEATTEEGESALYAASLEGHEMVVDILLALGANVNARGGLYGNALQAAALRGKKDTIRVLLDAGADVNAQGGAYGNALQAAAVFGRDVDSLQALLNADADVNAQGGVYGNALQAAAAFGRDFESLQALLNAGADVNAQGGVYGNALQASAVGRAGDATRLLLHAGADANAQGGVYGNALQAAASFGIDIDTLQALLNAGADVNAQGGLYGNALQAAAVFGRDVDSLQALLNADADVNAQGGVYGNALQAAAAFGTDVDILQVLLNAGANVNAQGGKYGNALQAAALCGKEDTIRVLLDAGADVNAQGGKYGNAWQAAAVSRTECGVFELILETGGHVNARGGKYGSPLAGALCVSKIKRAEILLRAGANTLVADEFERTPLHFAALHNALDLLHHFPKLLLSVNKRDMLSQTPFHLAICLGHDEFATILLQSGADPSLSDGYGRNSLDWAIENEVLAHQIRNHWPSIVTTPQKIQQLTVRQSIIQISQRILQFQLDIPLPLVRQLGHYLLFVGDSDKAQRLFQMDLNEDPAHSKTVCDICTQTIDHWLPVDESCSQKRLCQPCYKKDRLHYGLHPDQRYRVFQVLHDCERNLPSTTSEMKELRKIVGGLLAQNVDGSGTERSNDSTPSRPSPVMLSSFLGVKNLSPDSGSVSIMCYLLVGLVAVLCAYWCVLL